MAIAIDATSRSGFETGASATLAHTCSGTDRILFVNVNDFADGSSGAPTVTYAGVSMTLIARVGYPSSHDNNHLFYLVNPVAGTNNISVTRPTVNSSMNILAASYTGVDQTSPIDASTTSYNDIYPPPVSTLSASLTVGSASNWLVAGVGAQGTVSANTSNLVSRIMPSGNNEMAIFDSNATIAAGSTTATINISHKTAMILVSLKAAGAVPAAANTRGMFELIEKA